MKIDLTQQEISIGGAEVRTDDIESVRRYPNKLVITYLRKYSAIAPASAQIVYSDKFYTLSGKDDLQDAQHIQLNLNKSHVLYGEFKGSYIHFFTKFSAYWAVDPKNSNIKEFTFVDKNGTKLFVNPDRIKTVEVTADSTPEDGIYNFKIVSVDGKTFYTTDTEAGSKIMNAVKGEVFIPTAAPGITSSGSISANGGNVIFQEAINSEGKKVIQALDTNGNVLSEINSTQKSIIIAAADDSSQAELVTVTVKGMEIKEVFASNGVNKDKPANVGKSTVNLDGVTLTSAVAAGVKNYGTCKEAVLNITNSSNDQTKTRWIYPAFGPNGAGVDPNGNENITSKSVINITDSNVGYCAAGGGLSYCRTIDGELNITGGSVCGIYAVGSNGHTENAKIVVKNVDFTKIPQGNLELAVINRGTVGSADILFENCTFPSTPATYAGAKAYYYLGETYRSRGSDAGSNQPMGIHGDVKVSFVNCVATPTVVLGYGIDTAKSVTVTGADVLATTIELTSKKTHNVWNTTVGGKWSFDGDFTVDATVSADSNFDHVTAKNIVDNRVPAEEEAPEAAPEA